MAIRLDTTGSMAAVCQEHITIRENVGLPPAFWSVVQLLVLSCILCGQRYQYLCIFLTAPSASLRLISGIKYALI